MLALSSELFGAVSPRYLVLVRTSCVEAPRTLSGMSIACWPWSLRRFQLSACWPSSLRQNVGGTLLRGMNLVLLALLPLAHLASACCEPGIWQTLDCYFVVVGTFYYVG